MSKKAKGSTLISYVIGLIIAGIILYSSTYFMVDSTKIITQGFSDFKNRIRTYNLTQYFLDDVTTAAEINIKDENKTLEIIESGSSAPKVIYEFKNKSLYITEKGAASPMMALKAEDVEFSNDGGLIRMVAVTDKRSNFNIDISAYVRAQ